MASMLSVLFSVLICHIADSNSLYSLVLILLDVKNLLCTIAIPPPLLFDFLCLL